MSLSFLNFLTGNTGTNLRDFRHANRLYLSDSYARTPKIGFLYFVSFKVNSKAVVDSTWFAKGNGPNEVGLLAKRVDLPKFKIDTETLNQYNRKTVVQTKLSYNSISMELHDDISNLTHNLWVNYFKHYYADGNYGTSESNKTNKTTGAAAFSDTKYGAKDYTYGRYNRGDGKIGEFFTSIDIYVLHSGYFTRYTLVNPKIIDWAHDTVDQSEDGKVLKNKLSISYENVIYVDGKITKSTPDNWTAIFYDNETSPNGKTGTGRGGGFFSSSNPLLQIGSILGKNYVNKNGLGKLGPLGYNIAGGVMGAISGIGKGTSSSSAPGASQPGIFKLPGGAGINIFKAINTSINGKITANPAAIIFRR